MKVSKSKSKNKENLPQHHDIKALSKSAKLKSKSVRPCCPLKNEVLRTCNHSLDGSQLTVKSAQTKREFRNKISSKNSSEVQLKGQQRTRKVVPVNLDQTFIKLNEISKHKNSRKQSDYVSYLVQAQKKAMDSLANIQNSCLSNLQNSSFINNSYDPHGGSLSQLHQLKQEMKGLKQKFERLQSEQNQKDMRVSKNKDPNQKIIEVLKQISNKNTIQYEGHALYAKQVNKDMGDKYSAIISEYEKMFRFYQGRLESFEEEVKTQKNERAQLQSQNAKLKIVIKNQEVRLREKQKEVEKSQLQNLQSLKNLKAHLTGLQQQLRSRQSEVMKKEQQINSSAIKYEQQLSKKNSQIELFIERDNNMIQTSLKAKQQHIEQVNRLNQALKQMQHELQRQSTTLKQETMEKQKMTKALKSQLEYCNDQRRKELEDLKDQFSRQKCLANHQIAALKSQVQQKNNEIQAIQNESNQVKSSFSIQISELNEKVDSLMQKVQCKDGEIKEKQQVLQQKINQIENIKKQFNELTNTLSQQLYRVKQDNQISCKQIQVKSLNLAVLTKQKQLIQKQLLVEKENYLRLKEQIDRRQSKIILKEQQNANLKELLNALKNQVEVIKDQFRENEICTEEVFKEKEQLAGKYKKLLQDKTQIIKQKQQLVVDKQQILTEKEQLLAKIWNLAQTMALKNDQIEEMQSISNTQKLNKETMIVKLTQQAEQVTHQKQLSYQLNQLKDSQIFSLRQQIVNLSSQCQKKLQFISTKYEERQKNWKAEIEAIRSDVLERQKIIQENQSLIRCKQTEIEEFKLTVQKMNEKLDDQDQKVRRIRNQLNDSLNVITSLKTQNRQLSQQLEITIQSLSSLTSRYEESQTSFRELNQQKSEYINQIKEACQQNKREIMSSMRSKIDELVGDIQDLQQIVKQKNVQIERLEKNNKVIDGFKIDIEELKKKLELAYSSISEKNNQIATQKMRCELIQTQISEGGKKSISLNQKILDLQKEIKNKINEVSQQRLLNEKMATELNQNRERQNGFVQKIAILKQQNSAIITTYNYQLQQRKQIIQDLMRQKKQLYQQLNCEGV